ncbi:MAG TPA: Bax inhibitor-1/YccA family protein [Thermoanaerobaculia bacterium]
MDRFEMTPRSAFEAGALTVGADRVTAFLRKVYGWMFVGLSITAATAFAVASSPALMSAIFRNWMVFGVLIVAEFGLVIGLSARVDKMSGRTAAILFLVYSALNGATLSAILLVFTGASIATTFLVAGAMFGALALYGTTTKKSLAGVGQFFFMGLIGLVLASIVGMFWKAPGLQFVISVVGVLVFTGLTAWDSQRLKAMAAVTPDNQVTGRAVVGALALYLDFVNLFLFLLRFLGARRD